MKSELMILNMTRLQGCLQSFESNVQTIDFSPDLGTNFFLKKTRITMSR